MPLKQRLSRAALVCRSWAKAADLVPLHVEATVEDKSHAQQLQTWLNSKSAKVVSLQLQLDTRNWHPAFKSKRFVPAPGTWTYPLPRYSSNKSALSFELPCGALGQLTSLKVSGFNVLLSPPQPDSSSSSPAAVLPKLQQLELSKCEMHLTVLELLQHATTLTSLALAPVNISRFHRSSSNFSWALFSAAMLELLGKLPLLAELAFHVTASCRALVDEPGFKDLKLSEGGLLSSMQHLRSISLPYYACSRSTLAALPTGLTVLVLDGDAPINNQERYRLSMQTVSELPCLDALQELRVSSYWIDPAILPHFPQLRHLTLRHALVFTQRDEGELDLELGQFPTGREPEALLSSLLQLTQLQHLELQRMSLAMDPDNAVLDPQQAQYYAALTASEDLTALVLDGSCLGLPDDAWRHMLPPGKELPHLQVLKIYPAVDSLFCAAAAQRWVSCCPALQQLTLFKVPDSAVLGALLPLHTGLKHLTIGGPGCDDDAATSVAQLIGLESLEWMGDGEEGAISVSDLTSAGRQKLTALQGLTTLIIQVIPPLNFWSTGTVPDPERRWYSNGPRVADKMSLQVTLLASEDAPDVWQQLQQVNEELCPSWREQLCGLGFVFLYFGVLCFFLVFLNLYIRIIKEYYIN